MDHLIIVTPGFYFPLQAWVGYSHWDQAGMHVLFAVMAIATMLIMLGLFYRMATVIFFLAFTYVELIDVTNYLNHYYFISIISFLLIWVPANAYYSLDIRFRLAAERTQVPRLDDRHLSSAALHGIFRCRPCKAGS